MDLGKPGEVSGMLKKALKVVDTFYDIGVTFARQFENNSMRKLKFELRTVLRQIETP